MADARLFDGINDDRRTFFTEPGFETDVGGSSRLSYECFFGGRISEVPLAGLPLFKLLCWKRVFRCFGIGGSFKLTWLPRSALDAISND